MAHRTGDPRRREPSAPEGATASRAPGPTHREPVARDRAPGSREPLPRPIERAAHRLYAHVSWTTLGRLPLLGPEARAPLEGHLIALCRRLDVEPVSAVALADRVHLLLRHKPAHSLARLVPALKRGALEAMARPGDPLAWGSGFAAASVGGRELRTLVRALAALSEREEADGGRRARRRAAASPPRPRRERPG